MKIRYRIKESARRSFKGCAPASKIEACSQALHNDDDKRSRWLTTWIPISDAIGASVFPLHIEKIWHPILSGVLCKSEDAFRS